MDKDLSKKVFFDILVNIKDILKKEGVRGGIEQFDEIINFVFIKLLSEKQELTYWDKLKNSIDEDLYYEINKIKQIINDKFQFELIKDIKIKNNSVIRSIVSNLDKLEVGKIDSDISGYIFEFFINSAHHNGGLGEYYTPRSVTKYLLNLIDIKQYESIYDPFCGTGGFLVTAAEENKGNMFFGGEISNSARIAKMNLILHGKEHKYISQIDSLANPIDGLYDVVITNIPFSQKVDKDITNLYYQGIAKSNGNSVCILHCLKALKEGGRMLVIVPDVVLYQNIYEKIREFLLTNANLDTIISLPKNTFSPYAEVNTSALYFTNAHIKDEQQKEFRYLEVKNIEELEV